MSRTAILFTGQGFAVEQVASGSSDFDDLLRNAYAEVFAEAMPDLAKLSPGQMAQNEISALLLLRSALHHIKELKCASPIDVAAVAGYSVGQYIALHFAEVFDAETLAQLVLARCKAMNQVATAQNGGMMAVLGLAGKVVLKLVAEHSDEVYLANDNAVGNLTLAGDRQQLRTLATQLQQAGAYKVQALTTSGAWHCPMMAAALPELGAILAKTPFQSPSLPVIDNVTGEAFDANPEQIKQQLLTHLQASVLWKKSVKTLAAMGVDKAIELTGFDLLTRMGPHIARSIQFASAG